MAGGFCLDTLPRLWHRWLAFARHSRIGVP